MSKFCKDWLTTKVVCNSLLSLCLSNATLRLLNSSALGTSKKRKKEIQYIFCAKLKYPMKIYHFHCERRKRKKIILLFYISGQISKNNLVIQRCDPKFFVMEEQNPYYESLTGAQFRTNNVVS